MKNLKIMFIPLFFFILPIHTMAKHFAYILTGGPGSGKTTLKDYFKNHQERTISESAVIVIEEFLSKGIEEPWNLDDFQLMIADQQIKNETVVHFYFLEKKRCFLDRTIFDGFPYLFFRKKNNMLNRLLEKVDAFNIENYSKYVFLILNADTIETTPLRQESFDESMKIQRLIKAFYQKIGFEVIDVAHEALEKRALFITNYLQNKEEETTPLFTNHHQLKQAIRIAFLELQNIDL